ncbi:UDP-N-acetylmuramate--L-alanine ligase [Candidatus Daviesbacteria bacterium]|nr:UDP-N-acetylmuramate--L-alanine ligase [Candidatus Daviesbacteria bacterium]
MKKVHFLGIGGSGASAAAAIAKAYGFEVSGCDLEPNNEFTLHIGSVKLSQGHSASHLKSGNVDILAVTPAIYSLDPNNPELLEAKGGEIPILTWQEFMGKYLMKDKFVIAVCGTHGKTTTTAMIAKILEDAGLDPTVELGTIVPWWKANYRISSRHSERSEESHDSKSRDLSLITRDDKKGFFLVEADEFNDNFLATSPDISVVTNIEMDHPEYFQDFDSYKDSFKKFLESTKQTIVANLSDPVVTEILNVHPKGGNITLDYSKKPIDFSLEIPGEFNRWNASAAYQVGLLLGISPQTIQKSLSNYPGIGRRFEYIGEYHPSTSSGQVGAKVYSDFGHHPTEIKTTMQAAREKFPKNRIILIYQPHMFSRTKALFDDFVKVFKELPVDKIIITDIYPSREVDTGLVTSKQLVEAVGSSNLVYHTKDQIIPMLKHHVQSGDIIFFMGAGDIDKIAKQLVG